MDTGFLIKQAIEAQKQAYAPYSGFRVGAAILCTDGSIYTGCNVENAAYSASNCAERTAVFKAVSDGRHRFLAIAVVGNLEGRENERELCAPCGVCRQVLSEFTDGSLRVILARSETEYEEYTLKELLPLQFSKKNLQ
ncbi:cytidine deaminase [Ruminococcus gauvreauii]|uniref:Cytidine deaminase n=1 Tax=Ruminococcus gauvreauii TaxID=438033 RepID=A0ABY5VJF3_9FIRM|nr:cytidine deaminase [Ruminococcus gauvreauii]UWP60319.1 cytidine deaminase [Ruminococcus gauvreauii]